MNVFVMEFDAVLLCGLPEPKRDAKLPDELLALQKLSLSRGPSSLDGPLMRSGAFEPRVDARSAEIQDKPSPIPQVPVYYEAQSSFSASSPEILLEVRDLLREMQVEARYDALKHQLACCAFKSGSSCTFVISLFQASAGQYVVELQRRSGCVMVSRKIFEAISGKFTRRKVVPSWGQVELDDETSEILLKMASLSGSEQQCEAFRLLCDIAAGRDSHDKILTLFGGAGKLVELLLDALNSGDLETERYVCVFLAHMCCGGAGAGVALPADAPPPKAQREIQSHFVEKLFLPLSRLFIDMDSLGSQDSKKHVLRCLDSLSPPMVREVKKRYAKQCRDVPSSVSPGDEISPLVRASFGRFLEVQ